MLATGYAGEGIELLDADESDMAQVQAIYAHHVIYGSSSFETEPPSLEEMLQRRRAVVDKGLPYLVAKEQGQVIGYCYLSPYRPRYAYRFTVEGSVYMAEGQQGKGVGKRLMTEAIARAERGGWRQMMAVVGNSENIASLRLHQSLGFTVIGQLTGVGYKHGRWLNTIMMQRTLGEGDTTPPIDCTR
ncbi:GNAT family N-acetyltransferase [Rouxiella chamberiensis]|uniref:GNAT family N-acetyltransferase n=1 Tax=Rouxiella chamberiensis TaxID=1513468 RepID=A0ABY7HST1_9GAMM|nr:GNAT family N-acetyltransferase [Rouxiella chamberiensis]WAT02458.1 GNAT family N-acetyltransferase [Rouxiella chamberiensis]